MNVCRQWRFHEISSGFAYHPASLAISFHSWRTLSSRLRNGGLNDNRLSPHDFPSPSPCFTPVHPGWLEVSIKQRRRMRCHLRFHRDNWSSQAIVQSHPWSHPVRGLVFFSLVKWRNSDHKQDQPGLWQHTWCNYQGRIRRMESARVQAGHPSGHRWTSKMIDDTYEM